MKTVASLLMGPLLAIASGQVTQAMIDEAAGNQVKAVAITALPAVFNAVALQPAHS